MLYIPQKQYRAKLSKFKRDIQKEDPFFSPAKGAIAGCVACL
jgi:hypothetical protein